MGFCVSVAGYVVGKGWGYYAENNFRRIPDEYNQLTIQNMTEYFGSSTHLTEALTIETLKTLDFPIDNGIPFYLNFCHFAVHTPIHRGPRFFQKSIDRGMDEGQALELYNIRQDITERNDLSDSNPEKLQEMADALSAKLKGYDALMPTFRSTGDIVPMPDELAGRTAICPSDIQPTSQGH